jgi:hypothetical protein
MARINLRYCTIKLQDGLAGTASVAQATTVSPPGAPTAAVGAAGALTGDYLYKITFVDDYGETSGGTESSTVSPSSQTVDLSAIPTGPTGVTARKIYRTAAGGATGTEKFVAELSDNTTTTYIDNIADGSLGADVPTSNTATAHPMSGDTLLPITSVSLNTDTTNLVPIGARFTVATETNTPVHTVQTRTPSSMGPTTEITFTPALGAGSYTGTDAITFQPQQLSIKVGDGDLKYTENPTYQYFNDRGILDTVRLGDDTPMDVDLNFVFEHITTGTNETIAPMDALKRMGSASEWVSSATDKCEPYAVDLIVEQDPPCGTNQKDIFTFPDFRADKREASFKDANIVITGRCMAVEPIVTRSN